MSVEVTFTPGTLPTGFCHTTWQTTFNTMVNNLTGTVPLTVGTFVMGQSTPDEADQDKFWVQVDASNNLVGVYTFSDTYAEWVRPHPLQAGQAWCIPFRGTTAEIELLDGGEAGAITACTGAFWEEDTDMRGVFPLGVPAANTMPSGVTVALDATGGEETHELSVEESVRHEHLSDETYTRKADILGPNKTSTIVTTNTTTSETVEGDPFTVTEPWGGTETLGLNHAEPHENMPPYRALYFIKRTARVYYRG